MSFKNYAYAGLMLLALGAYFFAGRMGILAHQDPGEMDTGAYLEASLDIRQTGGILRHIPNCLNGVYKEATQHPLYLLFLSPRAERSTRFFVWAKLMTYGVGFAFLVLLFLGFRKIFGPKTAILSLCLTLLSATFIHMTTMVACESLLALFFILFWIFAVLGFKKNQYWLASGIAASLTFLTKSIGILLLPIFFLSALWFYRENMRSLILNKYFLGFFVLFFLIASPLFIRNYKVYGTPFYSDSKAVLWIDKWNDYNSPEEIRKKFTIQNYLKTHTPAEILRIFAEGFYGRNVQMLVDGLKPLPFWDRTMDLKVLQGFHEKTVAWQGTWAFLVYALFLSGLWMRRKEPDVLLTLMACAIFFIFVGWFSKIFSGTPPTRLLYPILFLILVYAAFAISRIFSHEKGFIGCVLIFLTAYLFMIASREDLRTKDLSRSYAFNKIFAAQIVWVRDHVQKGEKFLAGNVFMSNIFYYREGIRGEAVVWPAVYSIDEAKQYIADKKINYIFMDISTVLYNFQAFGPYFRVNPKTGLSRIKALPPFFKHLPRDPRIPPLYEIYSIEAQNT